ncbi:MAG: hypothetical protein JWM64_1250 [Frankiales bacterium]|nr:hypothetical protein [Frankiales bacterium]
MARRTAYVRTLEEHPNLPEVLGVLAQLAHVTDADLVRLSDAWVNTVAVAEARDHALSPDSPLVCEVLAAFEAVQALFADDVRGEASYVTVDAQVAVRALKAVRDAIAAAYARPVLARGEHAALLRPWRTVYAAASALDEPDLGPRAAQVKALLSALPALSARCHDDAGQALYDALVDRSFVQESDREQAREAAFQAAVLTSRRRTWALVRRSGAEGLSRPCPTCRTSPSSEREDQRVLALCLDAACALLVADAVTDDVAALLIDPVTALIPLQRLPSSS